MTAPALPSTTARRPLVVTVALVPMVLTAIINVLPGDETPPLAILVASIVYCVLLVVAVVGLWMCRRWGFILGISALPLDILLSLIALVLGPEEIRIVVAVGIGICAIILTLLARPAARQSYR